MSMQTGLPSDKYAGEIFKKGFKLKAVRTNPFSSKEDVWKEYNNFINSLSQNCFDECIIQIIQMLNYGGKSATQYKNAEEHWKVALERWPRLKTYSQLLLDWVKDCRKDAGLEV